MASRWSPGGRLDVVRVDVSTGSVESLTRDRAKDVEPSWSPDGSHVVFRSDRDGTSNLYALRLVELGRGGGYIMGSHSIAGDISPEVYDRYRKLTREHGRFR